MLKISLLGILGVNTTFLLSRPPDINPESPTWVGAWWIGFLISGALAFLLSVPLFGYPSRLRKSTAGMRCSGRRSRKIEHDIDMNDLGVSDVNIDKPISGSGKSADAAYARFEVTPCFRVLY